MSCSPLQLSYDSHDGFHLSVKVAFNKDSLNLFTQNKTYKSYIIEGIEQNWSGIYQMDSELKQACSNFFSWQKTNNRLFKQDSGKLSECKHAKNIVFQLSEQHLTELPLDVKLEEDPLSGLQNPRIVFLKRLFQGEPRPIPIFVKKTTILPSHVASGLFRRFWGIFRTGQIESMGYNWSRNFPGFAVINDFRNSHRLRQVSAHEAGHLFGIGDAYDAWYRFFYAAPGTKEYMMHYNTQVHPQEIAMLIRAYVKNKAQFFPRKFNLRRFSKGFYQEIKFYFKKIFRLFRKRS
ncbi:MAG TPA: hypothetical protein GXZ43_06290 [Clostridiaceae bacterium]|nr:hypothetical protein [Clostridiaceae bacterium]